MEAGNEGATMKRTFALLTGATIALGWLAIVPDANGHGRHFGPYGYYYGGGPYNYYYGGPYNDYYGGMQFNQRRHAFYNLTNACGTSHWLGLWRPYCSRSVLHSRGKDGAFARLHKENAEGARHRFGPGDEKKEGDHVK